MSTLGGASGILDIPFLTNWEESASRRLVFNPAEILMEEVALVDALCRSF